MSTSSHAAADPMGMILPDSNPLFHDIVSRFAFDLQLVIFCQIPPQYLFTHRRVSRAWSSMLKNPALLRAVHDRLPFLSTAPTLEARMKRRMRMLRRDPVWVKPFDEVFPWAAAPVGVRHKGKSGDKRSAPWINSGTEHDLRWPWVRYWKGYLAVISWGMPMDIWKALREWGHSRRLRRDQARNVTLRIGQVGKVDLFEIDLFEKLREKAPESYSKWVEALAEMDQEIIRTSNNSDINNIIILMKRELKALIPFHLYIEEGIVLVGLRAVEKTGDGLLAPLPGGEIMGCGDFFFLFSVRDGSLLQFIHVPPSPLLYQRERLPQDVPHWVFGGTYMLLYSRLNSSLLSLCYRVVIDYVPQDGTNDNEDSLHLKSWIILTTFSVVTGSKVGSDIVISKPAVDEGPLCRRSSRFYLVRESLSRTPICAMGSGGEIYLPLQTIDRAKANSDIMADQLCTDQPLIMFIESHDDYPKTRGRGGDGFDGEIRYKSCRLSQLSSVAWGGQSFAVLNPTKRAPSSASVKHDIDHESIVIQQSLQLLLPIKPYSLQSTKVLASNNNNTLCSAEIVLSHQTNSDAPEDRIKNTDSILTLHTWRLPQTHATALTTPASAMPKTLPILCAYTLSLPKTLREHYGIPFKPEPKNTSRYRSQEFSPVPPSPTADPIDRKILELLLPQIHHCEITTSDNRQFEIGATQCANMISPVVWGYLAPRVQRYDSDGSPGFTLAHGDGTSPPGEENASSSNRNLNLAPGPVVLLPYPGEPHGKEDKNWKVSTSGIPHTAIAKWIAHWSGVDYEAEGLCEAELPTVSASWVFGNDGFAVWDVQAKARVKGGKKKRRGSKTERTAWVVCWDEDFNG